jgi:hypothetical protein
MKKPFRVATMFTGAAACAAAFTPAAQAAAMPAAPDAATHDLAPGITATGNVTATDDCGSRTIGWLYLYYTASEHHGPVCLGGTGTVYLDDSTKIAGICTGANYGHLYGYWINQGTPSVLSFSFGPRVVLPFQAGPGYISSLKLTHHSGPPYFSCPASI